MKQREIKFRAWDKNLNTFHMFDLSNDKGEMIPVNLMGVPRGLKLDQFTGLLDKNGKEIYEGDILKFRSDILEVKWGKTGFLHLMFNDESEVIGNIYENPELLKEGLND